MVVRRREQKDPEGGERPDVAVRPVVVYPVAADIHAGGEVGFDAARVVRDVVRGCRASPNPHRSAVARDPRNVDPHREWTYDARATSGSSDDYLLDLDVSRVRAHTDPPVEAVDGSCRGVTEDVDVAEVVRVDPGLH